MSDSNKSYRIRTNIGGNSSINLNVNLLQDYDIFEILSLKIDTENLYKLHTSKYGCLVGRVVANGGVGVPNAKLSVFIEADAMDLNDPVFNYIYPYVNTKTKNREHIRYNLLTDEKLDACHQDIGTFPNKRLVLDDDNYLEVFEKYYKFTTTTNGSGDYMIFGLPVGNNIIHSDLDLSDIGILSQKPRDLFYKGYSATQFENSSMFKKDTNLDGLTQVFSQDSSVYVYPFWGDETENADQIKITRNDIDINYKFEPTCIFIGSIVSDEKSNAISKNCIPHERMGKMDRLTTGNGTIEMIRKTLAGNVESISIQGNELIDGNGTWCYQIPMNLDYMKTDEYGRLVPTNDTDNGIPTRARVRFRVSLADYESDYENSHLVKVLVPNNPTVTIEKKQGEGNSVQESRYLNYDYEFGSNTLDESYRDLFWNNVYTVKQHIPRIQKGNRQRNKNFTGFKAVNVNGSNNPIPYNNMRINLTFLFVFQCLIFKSLVMIVKIINRVLAILSGFGCGPSTIPVMTYVTLDGGMCTNLEGNYIAPGARDDRGNSQDMIDLTYKSLTEGEISSDKDYNSQTTSTAYDKYSADSKNSDYQDGKLKKTFDEDGNEEDIKVYKNEDYFIKCVELQFALEYEVIQFDFYNDWLNGVLYIPRWFAEARRNKEGMVYCGEGFNYHRNLVQQCALAYNSDFNFAQDIPYGCSDYNKQRCHKKHGRRYRSIFGTRNHGIVERSKTSKGHYAYYLRPSEIISGNKKVNLFATDLVLLGSVNECNQYGLPTVKGYTSSSYIMPPPTGEIIYDTQEMETEDLTNSVYEFDCGKIGSDVYYVNYEGKYLLFVSSNFLGSSKWREGYSKIVINNILKIGNNEYYKVVGKSSFFNSYISGIGYMYYIVYLDHEITNPQGLNVTLMMNLNDYNVVYYGLNSEVHNKISVSCRPDYLSYLSSGNKIMFEDKMELGKYKITSIEEQASGINMYTLTLDNDINPDNRPATGTTVFINRSDIKKLYIFNKEIITGTTETIDGVDETEYTYNELAGVDWGYNPHYSGSEDDTTLVAKQNTGHFLEIGCTYSLSNIKSCVNLTRICEIGSEMSQSHYYETNSNFVRPAGIIGKREVIDSGIRTTFATLNSSGLKCVLDPNTGYIRHYFNGYVPDSFMGEFTTLLSANEQYKPLLESGFSFIESSSLSYKAFRFGDTGATVEEHFLIKDGNNKYYMPVFENSFYFYFGLKDGSTAIDRLYSEYYAECPDEMNEGNIVPSLELIADRILLLGNLANNKAKIHYIVNGLGRVDESMFTIQKMNGTQWVEIGDVSIDLVAKTITVKGVGKYKVTITNRTGVSVSAEVEVKNRDLTDLNIHTTDPNISTNLDDITAL